MTTHARLSPSGAKRWMTCPGSIALVESLNIEDSSSKYAAEGTVAHEVHEKCLLEKLEAKHFLGYKFQADGMEFTVNQNMVDAVQESLDYIRTRIEEAEDFGLRVEMLVEVRSSLKFLKIPGLDGGTADVILLFWDGEDCVEVEIIDYKHGQGVAVEVIDNPQAMCYGLGVIYLPALNGSSVMDGVKITISQPRAFHPDGPIRTWETTKDYLRNWEDDELVPKAKATLEPKAKLVPSDDGCRFCGANGQCSALYDKTQEIAIADFAEDSFPDPLVMTAEQKMIVMEHASMLRAFIVAVEANVQQEVDKGSTDYEEHYKLVRKTTQRRLKEDALDADFSPLLEYLDEEEFYERKPKAMGALEKAVKEKMKADGVKGFVKAAKEIMSEVTFKPEGSLVIAPMSDKRRAVQASLTSDFKDLD